MTKNFLKAGGAALTVLALTAAATAVQSRTATEAAIKTAESDARSATQALAKRKPAVAVRFAERAVQLRPQDATYRALLGKAYLAAGRFASARQAFADALSLDAGQTNVALNYALATTATGDFAAAQQIIDGNAAAIAPADRGLALALAGNPAAGVEVLMVAARAPDATAKTRQNLALTLALAGRWPEARQLALADLSPTDADARIVQWAAFARPAGAADQVATLLGVRPAADDGQPVALALVAAPSQVAAAEPAPPAPVAEAWAPDTPVVETAALAPRPSVGGVVFAARQEVVQRLPVSPLRTARGVAPVRVAAAVPTPSARGNFYVQLGAFRGPDGARAAWSRAKARHAVLAGKAPSTMAAGNGLHRVSVGGFARGDADALCGKVRAGGGACFVRVNAGDRVANWYRGVQVASR
ncbi:MAG: SPOR domain-containing protein [Pseudomonadota bacterium]